MISLIDAILAASVASLTLIVLVQSRKINDLKDSIITISRNPTRARKVIQEKYGNK